MADPSHIAFMVAVSAVITWALRAVPFAVLAPMRRSAVVRYLGSRMPLGIMMILAVYTLRDAPRADMGQVWALVAALGVTVGLHLWRRNALLSIIGGTAVNVLIVSLLLPG